VSHFRQKATVTGVRAPRQDAAGDAWPPAQVGTHTAVRLNPEADVTDGRCDE